MKKTSPKKLALTKESIRRLAETETANAKGEAPGGSRWDTCLTCLSCYRTCTC